MARGRKPKSETNLFIWEHFFNKNAGIYFQILLKELGNLNIELGENSALLLNEIKIKKEILIKNKKIKKEKDLAQIKKNEIPFNIPKNWVWCKFQEITKVITCGLASTPIYREEGRMFLSAKNIKPFRFIPEKHKYVDEETFIKITQNAKPEINDILITRVGAGIGETALIDQEIDFAFYVSLTLVKPLDGINSEYLVYWLNSPSGIQSAISQSTGTGSSQGNLNVEKVRNFLIPLPPFKEQIKISQFLNDLKNNDLKIGENYFNTKVENKILTINNFLLKTNELTYELTHQLNLIKQLRQAFLREAMQGKLVKSSNTKETGQQLLAKIKAEKAQLIAEKKLKKEKELAPITEDEIPFEIPENWAWCRLGEICNYGSSPKADPKDINDDTWVLDLEDIEKETSVLLNKIRFIERNSLSTKSIFKKGEVLYSKLRPYLDKVIVADEDGVCTTEILPLKIHGNINPYFLKYSLKRSDFLIYVNSVTKGMKMPRLGTTDGQLALMPLPPIHEQEQIVAKLEKLMAYCNGLEQSIKESQGHNDMLLQQVLREALQGETVN